MMISREQVLLMIDMLIREAQATIDDENYGDFELAYLKGKIGSLLELKAQLNLLID